MRYIEMFYAAPLFPIAGRLLLQCRFWPIMRQAIPAHEHDGDMRRGYALTLAGFSFSGLLALAVVDANTTMDFHVPVFHMLVSFLCFFLATSLQGYKSRRWHDQVGNAMTDVASLSLMLAVAATVLLEDDNRAFRVLVLVVILGAWTADFLIRLCISWNHFRKEQERLKGSLSA